MSHAASVRAGHAAVTTHGDALTAARDKVLDRAVEQGVAAALAGKDATLWGPEARAEAAVRLGWLDCTTTSREIVPRIAALRQELLGEGLDHVVLAGMGGSSLAPEVITGTYGVDLTVLDTTDPGQLRSALSDRLDRTVVVVASKSGSTVETDSHRRAYEQAFRDAGIDPAGHMVVVTDPGSPLEKTATDAGYRAVFTADPDVGGRYSALTAFGLVPSGLAGVPVGELLDQAAAVQGALAGNDGNPGLWLGAALGGAALEGRDKLVVADAGSGIAGLGDWIEQLIAESTGKQGRGILPVVVDGPDDPGFRPGADVHLLSIGEQPVADGTSVSGPLGAQFLLWEFATAIAGWVIGIDPFNQPNVTESKENTNAVLDHGLPHEEPAFTDGPIEVYGDLAKGAGSVAEVLERLLSALPDRGYLAVMAYLDRFGDAEVAGIRRALAPRTDRPVTFGWAPRFLHSTGQFHKGGPQVGGFLQVTGATTAEVDVPGRPFDFTTLQAAQAAGDREALLSRDRPFVRLHLTDRTAGARRLLAAAEKSGGGPR